MDWDGDFTAHSHTKGKEVARKSIVSALLGWAGHKMMLVVSMRHGTTCVLRPCLMASIIISQVFTLSIQPSSPRRTR